MRTLDVERLADGEYDVIKPLLVELHMGGVAQFKRQDVPVEQLKAWIGQMFWWMHDAELRMHLTVIDSDEVRVAKGYRQTRERAHADRERSLVEILRRGRDDGSFPLADPEHDAIAISAVVSREMLDQSPDDQQRLRRSLDWVLGFALRALGAQAKTRALGAEGKTTDRR